MALVLLSASSKSTVSKETLNRLTNGTGPVISKLIIYWRLYWWDLPAHYTDFFKNHQWSLYESALLCSQPDILIRTGTFSLTTLKTHTHIQMHWLKQCFYCEGLMATKTAPVCFTTYLGAVCFNFFHLFTARSALTHATVFMLHICVYMNCPMPLRRLYASFGEFSFNQDKAAFASGSTFIHKVLQRSI